MSKENGFYCENTEHGHITEAEAVECHGKTLLESSDRIMAYLISMLIEAKRAEQDND